MALDLLRDEVTVEPISNREIEIHLVAEGYVAKPSNGATLVGDGT